MHERRSPVCLPRLVSLLPGAVRLPFEGILSRSKRRNT